MEGGISGRVSRGGREWRGGRGCGGEGEGVGRRK